MATNYKIRSEKIRRRLAWIGYVQFPTSADPNAIIRNQFELLLQVWLFFNNEECPSNGRLNKIQKSTDKSKFKGVVRPGKTLY